TRTSLVRTQLPVGTGFEANPQQYLELDERHAFVPRLGENRLPGREPFDSGSDVLVVDPTAAAIIDSLPLPRKKGYLPNPSAISHIGADLLVTLVHANADFSDMADSELVAISASTLQVHYRLPLQGLKNCGRAEALPSQQRLVLACSSFLDRRGNAADPSASALVVLDLRQDPPVEVRRFTALELVGQALQRGVEV